MRLGVFASVSGANIRSFSVQNECGIEDGILKDASCDPNFVLLQEGIRQPLGSLGLHS